MIRLTKSQLSAVDIEIRAEGDLEGEATGQLRTLVEACRGQGQLSVNLIGLRSLDASSRDLLVQLRREGCRVFGGSLYITRMLDEVRL